MELICAFRLDFGRKWEMAPNPLWRAKSVAGLCDTQAAGTHWHSLGPPAKAGEWSPASLGEVQSALQYVLRRILMQPKTLPRKPLAQSILKICGFAPSHRSEVQKPACHGEDGLQALFLWELLRHQTLPAPEEGPSKVPEELYAPFVKWKTLC